MRTGELYQRYFGHYLATVIDLNDPQKLGRIRVQADQFADTLDQPVWASISRPAAGDQQGVFFTPKKGDQVVLCFLSGDVREPIVVGYAHSTQKMPANSLVGTQKHGVVTTIGSVIFDEEGKTITVTFAGPIPSTITMNSAGITIQGAGTINIQAPNVVINGRAVAPQPRPI
jgi:phage baseplate assembly protein gpV